MSQSEADPATDSAEGGAGAVDFSQDDVEVLQKRKKEFDEHVAETAELTKRHYEAPILLSKEQQSILETKKMNLRMANERYFRQHAEIKSMIKMFIEQCLKAKPDDTVSFAADFFCDHLLQQKLEAFNARSEL